MHLVALLVALHLTPAHPNPIAPCWFPHGVASGGGGSTPGKLDFSQSINSSLVAALGGF